MLPHSNGPQPHLASVPVLGDAPAKVITGALSASCVDVGDEENQEKKGGGSKEKTHVPNSHSRSHPFFSFTDEFNG